MKSALLILIFNVFVAMTFGQTSPTPPKPEVNHDFWKAMKRMDEKLANNKKELIRKSGNKNWFIYEESKYAITLYNLPTIVRKSNLVKVWSKRFNLLDKSYEMARIKIDCKEHEYQILDIMIYNSEGLLTKSIKPKLS